MGEVKWAMNVDNEYDCQSRKHYSSGAAVQDVSTVCVFGVKSLCWRC